MLRRLILTVPVLLAFSASTGLAQSRYSLDITGGAAFATEDLGTAALESGFGLGFTGNIRVMPHLHLYAGWDYQRFVTDELVAGTEFDVDDTGYAFGAKFEHPMLRKVDGWLRLGALYNHIELENQDGDIVSDTGHEFGWEAGAGLSIPITQRLSIVPGTRYRTTSSTLKVGNTETDVDLSYITAEIGLAFKFGGNPISAIRR